MAKRLLVDGYNLIALFRPPGKDRADALERSREELLRRLRALPASMAEEIVVVFDGRSGLGRAGRERWGGVEARFASAPGGADAMILELVAAERDRSRVTVVTSDRELAAGARRLGARILSSADFALRLGSGRDRTARDRIARRGGARRAPEKPSHPGPAEVERWEEEFRRRDRDEEPD